MMLSASDSKHLHVGGEVEGIAETNQIDADVVDQSLPVIFLGLADGASLQNASTPIEAWSLFQLARIKLHFAFPAIVKQAHWCFLVHSEALLEGKSMRVNVVNREGVNQAHLDFASSAISLAPAEAGQIRQGETSTAIEPGARDLIFLDKGQWLVQATAIADLVIPEPGEYRLMLQRGDSTSFLGKLVFVFAPPPPLTGEQIAALESDPVAPKSINMTFGCKHCDSKLRVYTATKKLQDEAQKEFTFYRDLPDRFACKCGRTNMNMAYLRDGMHGFLGRGARASIGEISYVQRYAHSQLLNVAGKFLELIQKEKKEEPIQKFLEKHKVLFARFHAKQLFVKPRILGKFNADFAILDSEGVLTLFEIERSNIKLFKKNGHLRSELNHAYEQVQDWLNEVSKHKTAVIEGLGLKQDEVLSIRGCVIAGRSKSENRDHLRRHMSQPRPNIEFFTFDMLGQSLVRIAHDLP